MFLKLVIFTTGMLVVGAVVLTGIYRFALPNNTNEDEHECPSRIIQKMELKNYVQNMLESNTFKDQYEQVKNGELKPAEVAKKPENLHKNRYPEDGLFPYDETRVILDPLPGDPSSDFINANYITGYNRPKEFIATQGPLKNTVFDFWRMIWQEKVVKILMFANVYEHGKIKVEKYWPDSVEKYGDITVTATGEEVYVDYTIRDFVVVREGHEGRLEVRQFHFTAWPDMGVPSYPLSVVTLLKAAKAFKPNSTAPVVHHCSAGIGRTGTVTLVRIMMDTIDGDGKVDVLKSLCRLRHERMNLVETAEQFAFVHKSLVEYLYGDYTNVPVKEFRAYYKKLQNTDPSLGYSLLEKQFKTFLSLKRPISPESATTANQIENVKKNTSSDILPPDEGRPIIYSGDGNEVYVNAVYANGYRKANSFIMTQHPHAETIQDFWLLVYESRADTIVALNELTEPFWATNGQEVYGEIRVTHETLSEEQGVAVHNFSIARIGKLNEVRIIRMFQMKGWKAHEAKPPSINAMLAVVNLVLQQEQRPIVVTCHNGARACGLFSASAFLTSQIRERSEVDVLMAARTAGKFRPSVIENFQQYQFLYDCAALQTSA